MFSLCLVLNYNDVEPGAICALNLRFVLYLGRSDDVFTYSCVSMGMSAVIVLEAAQANFIVLFFTIH